MAIQARGRHERAVLTVFLATPVRLLEILATLDWRIHEAHGVRDAVEFLATRRTPLILCHCSFDDGSWKDILSYISVLPRPPQLIVTSETADEFLWSEVLNLGGYDVLAQPFCEPEVARTLRSALHRWEEEASRARSSSAR